MGKITINMRDNSEFNEKDVIEMMEIEDMLISEENASNFEQEICMSEEYLDYIM